LRSDRRSQRDEVERFVDQWHAHLLGFDERCEQWIRLERGPTHRHLIAGPDVAEK
jgi:hypothetical protein